MLIKSYIQYYEDPSIESARELCEAIIGYDFGNYDHFSQEVARLRKEVLVEDCKKLTLRTNGTTGPPKCYSWGPNCNFWLKSLEDASKFNGRATLRINQRIPNPLDDHNFEITKNNKSTYPVKYTLTINPYYNKSALEYTIRKIKSIDEKINILAQPNAFLFLCSYDEFNDLIIDSEHIHSLIPYEWEPFFKKERLIDRGVWINDNMINWVTMFNFYTCPHNTRHSFPTFVVNNGRYINLLNLTAEPAFVMDDIVQLGKIKECPCGKSYVDMEFVLPHCNCSLDVCDDSIPEHLTAHYSNLQFIQEGDRLNILFIGKGSKQEDRLFLREKFNTLQVEFLPQHYAYIGRKLLPFWRNLKGLKYTSL
jgi:hypothetical protein